MKVDLCWHTSNFVLRARSVIVITEDLNLVGKIADRFAVMHRGKIVEHEPTAQIFEHPVDPYTRTPNDSRRAIQ